MTLKEIPMASGEQLMIPLIELGEVVREIASVEFAKAEANADWNWHLKILKKRMFALAANAKERE